MVEVDSKFVGRDLLVRLEKKLCDLTVDPGSAGVGKVLIDVMPDQFMTDCHL